MSERPGGTLCGLNTPGNEMRWVRMAGAGARTGVGGAEPVELTLLAAVRDDPRRPTPPHVAHLEAGRELADARLEGAGHADDAAPLRVVVVELVRVALGLDAHRRLDHVLDRWLRDASLDPVEAELLGLAVPDLLVVREQVLLGQPRAERVVEPLPEVRRRGVVVVEVVVEALEARSEEHT